MSNTSGSTTVANIWDGYYDVIIDRTTIFGNPFPERKYGRDGCIAKFRTYFYNRIEVDSEFKARVLELKGKRLGCHCKPKACHGDVIAEYLNAYDWVERIRKEYTDDDGETNQTSCGGRTVS